MAASCENISTTCVYLQWHLQWRRALFSSVLGGESVKMVQAAQEEMDGDRRESRIRSI